MPCSRIRMPIRLLALLGVLSLVPAAAHADVHTVKVVEFYTRCDNGSTSVQYIELRATTIGNLFRQCALLEIRRTLAGPVVFSLDPVFAGRGDDEAFPNGATFLIATPGFQAITGIAPDVLMPDGTLDPAGGVIRFAAEGGCAFEWGTIHEVPYGDQGFAPAPGPHQAATYRATTNTFVIGSRSPRNFAGQTASNWTCQPVPVEQRTWGGVKRLY